MSPNESSSLYHICEIILAQSTTLDILFSVAYYLELTQSYNYLPYVLFWANKGWVGCLNIIKHEHVYLIENYINSKKYLALCNSKYQVT